MLSCLATLMVALAASGGTFEFATVAELNSAANRLRADQFLKRTTFGPTEAEVVALGQRMDQIGVIAAAEEWIDNQFALPATRQVNLAKQMVLDDGIQLDSRNVWIQRYRFHAFWHAALAGPDQLRQRMAWALSQIVVLGEGSEGFDNEDVDVNGNPYWGAQSAYYDMLADNADKTYRKILGDVTFSPAMGAYLSHLRNAKADPARGTSPDENFAREIMQLFSIGLYQMNLDSTLKEDANGNPIPTYDNAAIQEMARLFTGFNYKGSTNLNWSWYAFYDPMVVHNAWHDSGSKNILGTTLPANTNGVADINAGLDVLYAHPNVAPFVSRLLIQRLVCSTPSRGYISRVAAVFNDNGQGVKGDMKAVVKAILLDREAWNSVLIQRRAKPWRMEVRQGPTELTKIIEPVLLYSQFLRRYGTSGYSTGRFMIPPMDWDFTQAPYRTPSVFNWYSPNFQPIGPISNFAASPRFIPGGKMYAPELQLFTSVMANRMANRYRWDIQNSRCDYTLVNNPASNGNPAFRRDSTVNLNFSAENALVNNPEALVRHLDLVLCTGTMTDDFRAALATAVSNVSGNTADGRENRVAGALLSVLMCPAHMTAN